MQKLVFLASIIVFLSSCQKENSVSVSNDSDAELKSVSFSSYNKVRNAILQKAETEFFCSTDYQYTQSVFVDGVEWQYPATGYEYLMYKGLTHVSDGSNDYFYAGLQHPILGTEQGIGFGHHFTSTQYYPFTAQVKVCIPEKNYSVTYSNAACFAIGNQSFANADSIRFVLYKKQNNDPATSLYTNISFSELRGKLGPTTLSAKLIQLGSSLGTISSYNNAVVYNWSFYGSTPEIYGLESAGTLSYNLNFGDGFSSTDCTGIIDVYLHDEDKVYKCSTRYSIFYNEYLGCRKQLHIYL